MNQQYRYKLPVHSKKISYIDIIITILAPQMADQAQGDSLSREQSQTNPARIWLKEHVWKLKKKTKVSI